MEEFSISPEIPILNADIFETISSKPDVVGILIITCQQ